MQHDMIRLRKYEINNCSITDVNDRVYLNTNYSYINFTSLENNVKFHKFMSENSWITYSQKTNIYTSFCRSVSSQIRLKTHNVIIYTALKTPSRKCFKKGLTKFIFRQVYSIIIRSPLTSNNFYPPFLLFMHKDKTVRLMTLFPERKTLTDKLNLTNQQWMVQEFTYRLLMKKKSRFYWCRKDTVLITMIDIRLMVSITH